MPALTIEYQTDAERLILEQALGLFTQMRRVSATAADGTVLAACAQVALDSGRQLIRDTLASAIQDRVSTTDASQKGPARGSKGNTPGGS